MRKVFVWTGVACLLGLIGCSRSLEKARADAHQDRAERALEHGRFRKAAKEERKAEKAREREEDAPLP